MKQTHAPGVLMIVQSFLSFVEKSLLKLAPGELQLVHECSTTNFFFVMFSTKYSTMPGRHSISEERQSYLKRLGYPELHSSNFLDLDLLSSSGNSCDEEAFERYHILLPVYILSHSLHSHPLVLLLRPIM